jgi:hypothetical protein
MIFHYYYVIQFILCQLNVWIFENLFSTWIVWIFPAIGAIATAMQNFIMIVQKSFNFFFLFLWCAPFDYLITGKRGPPSSTLVSLSIESWHRTILKIFIFFHNLIGIRFEQTCQTSEVNNFIHQSFIGVYSIFSRRI